MSTCQRSSTSHRSARVAADGARETLPQRWPSGALIVALLLAAGAAMAQVQFIEVGASRGIEAYVMAPGMGGGVAAADYDDDGDVDLFVPNAEGVPDQLYRNLGGGQFEEVADTVGLDSTLRSRSAVWLDYDGDQDLDLLVTGDCFDSACVPGQTVLRLFRQGESGSFREVTQEAGIFDDEANHTQSEHRAGVAAGDLNNDGYLDLLVTMWGGFAQLFQNQGDGAFSDISSSSGLGDVVRMHWQPVMHDFNGDGWLDIFVSIDFAENLLWINQQDNTFLEQAAAAGVDSAWNEMGVALADYDSDGDFDIYVTNIYNYTPGEHNVLFRNESQGDNLIFAEVSEAAGVEDTSWGWGTTFLDADNDGDLDLAATNGFGYDPYLTDQSKFFLHNGDQPATFSDVSSEVGFDDSYWGSSLIAFDYDRDGDLDLLQTSKVDPDPGPLRLLENQLDGGTPGKHFLLVRPRMPGANHRAIGAVVEATAAGESQVRPITAGISFLGQEPAEAFFGLGEAVQVDRLQVDWPRGGVTVLTDVAADQDLTVGWESIFSNGFESGDAGGWSSAVGSPPPIEGGGR